MNNKKIFSVMFFLCAFISGFSHAASGDKIQKVINITATIPNDTFYFKPLHGEWPTMVELKWNPRKEKFNDYTLKLKGKSTVGVTASLLSDAVLYSGDDTLELDVYLADEKVEVTGTKVLNRTALTVPAGEEHYLDLKIAAKTDATSNKVTSPQGMYTGSIVLMLEDAY